MFGSRLRELRKSRGITQEELARIIGVERSSIGKYEGKSHVIPSDDIKMKMAEYFGVSVDYLLGLSEDEKPAVNDSGLDDEIVTLLSDLSPGEVQRVQDFVAGLKASRKG